MIGAMLGPVFPLWIINVLHVPLSFVFFIMAIVGIGGSILNVFVGHVTDIIGKRKSVLEIAFLLAALRGVLYTTFPFVVVVIAASWLTQLSTGAITFSILIDKIKENGDEAREGMITSTVRTSVSLGYVFGPWMGITIVSLISYRLFFAVFALFYLILFVVTKLLIRDSGKVAHRKKGQRSIVTRRTIWILAATSLMIVFLFAGNLTSSSLLTLFLHRISPNSWMIAAAFGIGPFFEIVVIPMVGLLNDRIGSYKTLILGAVGEMLYFGMLAIVKSPMSVLFIQIFGTFYTAVLFTSLMIYVQKLFKDRVGFASSFYFSSMSVSRVICNFLLGSLLLRWGIRSGFALLAVFACLGLFMLMAVEFWFHSKNRVTDSAVTRDYSV